MTWAPKPRAPSTKVSALSLRRPFNTVSPEMIDPAITHLPFRVDGRFANELIVRLPPSNLVNTSKPSGRPGFAQGTASKIQDTGQLRVDGGCPTPRTATQAYRREESIAQPGKYPTSTRVWSAYAFVFSPRTALVAKFHRRECGPHRTATSPPQLPKSFALILEKNPGSFDGSMMAGSAEKSVPESVTGSRLLSQSTVFKSGL